MNLKKLLMIFIPIIILIIVGFIMYNNLFYSSLNIKIEGYHNPLSSLVFADNSRLYPSGNEGRIYDGKVRPGNTDIILTGPNIETVEESVDIGAGAALDKVIKSTEISAIQMAKNLIPLKPTENIEYASYYDYNSSWLLARVRNANSNASDIYYIHKYSFSEMEWKLVLADVKIDPEDDLLINAPNNLLIYINSQAGD